MTTTARQIALPEATAVAQEFVADISSKCRRIQIAGSIRRVMLFVKDIEIVAIPWLGEHIIERDLFGVEIGESYRGGLEDYIALGLAHGGWTWELDPIVRRNGPRYKRLRHIESGICCDLFLTSPRGWGGALAIRTGPADFSRALMILAKRRNKHVADGYLLHAHPKPDRGCPKGATCPLIIPTLEESDFLEALGLPWVEPESRSEAWLWETVKRETFRD